MIVELTAHAQERAEQRFRPEDSTNMRVAADVVRAIEEGRVSSEAPSWMIGEANGRASEFAWSPDRTRIYVIDRVSRGRVVVVTCMAGRGRLRRSS